MMAPPAPIALDVEQTDPPGRGDETRSHIRGSSLLLAGRLIALLLNLAVQVLIVRHLPKRDFGAFAYVLSVTALGSSIAVFGLDKSITRFAPIYQEQRDFRRMWGTIILSVAVIAAVGAATMAPVYLFRGTLLRTLVHDPEALSLLAILAALAPLQALDSLLVGLFAIFGNPRAIFFRKHVVGPGLQLAVVVALVATHSGVYTLAVGYLAATVLGIAVYIVALLRLFRNQGLFKHFHPRQVIVPWREVLGFTVPLLVSDLAFVLRSSLVVILLERYRTTADVAAFRAVWPVSRLNMVVYQNFAFLFMPVAARMYARSDREGVNDLYWRTALWIAVASFPVFAVTTCVSGPLTSVLFGQRYEQSAAILALLSLGFYFNASLGFNALTLRVYGRVRYVFMADLACAVISLGTSLALIPRYGAMGAAVATCATLVLQNVLYQAGLLTAGIRVFDRTYAPTYLTIALAGAGLALVQWASGPGPILSLTMAGIVSAAVLALSRGPLNVAQMFPEVLRLPLARRIFGTG